MHSCCDSLKNPAKPCFSSNMRTHDIKLRLLMTGHGIVLVGQSFSDKVSRHDFCFKASPVLTLSKLKYTAVFLYHLDMWCY